MVLGRGLLKRRREFHMLMLTIQEKTRVLRPWFLQDMKLFLACVSVFLPGVVGRSELTSGCTLLLAVVTH